MTEKQQQLFIDECRSWIGTGWMHGVCIKGYRVDCVRFLVAVAKKVGWLDSSYIVAPYPRDWALHRSESKLIDELSKFCIDVNLHEIQTGDILVYKFGRTSGHAAFYLQNGIAIHSHIDHGVAEFCIADMHDKFTHLMRFRGI